MIVRIVQGRMLLEHADDLRRLSAATDAGTLPAGVSADPNGAYLYVEVAALAAAMRQHGREPKPDFDRMVDFARQNGFVDTTGRALRVHIEPKR